MRRGQLFSSVIRWDRDQINREIFHSSSPWFPTLLPISVGGDWQSHQQGHMRGLKRVMPREPSLNDA